MGDRIFKFKALFLNNFHFIILLMGMVFTILRFPAILRFPKTWEIIFPHIGREFSHHKVYWISFIIVMIFLFLMYLLFSKSVKRSKIKVSKESFFEERPLDPKKGEKDELGVQHIVEEIVKSIRGFPAVNPMFIGISGAWGSGKTSLMKLVSYKLENDSKIIPVWFIPWHYQDDKSMIEGILNTIQNAIKEKSGVSLKSSIKKLTRIIKFRISYGPMEVEWQGRDSDIDKEKRKIGDWLYKNNYRLVVFLDDLDRLDERETKLLLKILREFLNFNSAVMVLGYDKSKLYEKLEIDTDKFFDIEIPLNIEKEMLGRWLENQAEKYEPLHHLFEEFKNRPHTLSDFKKAFGEFSTLREVKQFCNELLLAWPVIKDEVFLTHFAIICIMRRKLPELYQVLSEGKYYLLMEKAEGELGSAVWKDLVNRLVENLAVDKFGNYDLEKAANIASFISALGNVSFERTADNSKLTVEEKADLGKYIEKLVEGIPHPFWKSEHPERYFLWRPPAYSYPAARLRKLLKKLSKETSKEKIKSSLNSEIKISIRIRKIRSFCNQLKDKLLSSEAKRELGLIRSIFYEEMIELMDSFDDLENIEFFSDIIHSVAISYGHPERCQRFSEAIPKIKNPFKSILFLTKYLIKGRKPVTVLEACPSLKEIFQKQCEKIFLKEEANICKLAFKDIGRIVKLFKIWEDKESIVKYLKKLKEKDPDCVQAIKSELSKFETDPFLSEIAKQLY